eukprot:4940260-Amphidinium_carterae.3
MDATQHKARLMQGDCLPCACRATSMEACPRAHLFASLREINGGSSNTERELETFSYHKRVLPAAFVASPVARNKY